MIRVQVSLKESSGSQELEGCPSERLWGWLCCALV